MECKQCGLTLVSAPHLARSYHHLFPIKQFIEREYVADVAGSATHCFACAKSLDASDKQVSCFTSFIMSRFDVIGC